MNHLSAMPSTRGTVFNIQRFSLNDGPGIRTVVFLKGCPLRCPWCSNPESQNLNPEILYNRDKCIRCGACISVCSHKALSSGPDGYTHVDRSRCTGCGACAAECSSDALYLSGESMSAQEVIQTVQKDAVCYRHGNGGVTLSGGEPLMQRAFTREILQGCKLHGLHTAIETTGCTDTAALDEILPYTDLFLFDIKHLDAKLHQDTVRTGNSRILSHFQRLIHHGANVTARIPLIPEFNTDDAYLERLRAFLETSTVPEVHLLPYHIYGEGKYASLGRLYQMNIPPMQEEEASRIAGILSSRHYQLKLHG